jgi:hypothetical protein
MKMEKKITEALKSFGLDFDAVADVASYNGFPDRYPHWTWGEEYEKLFEDRMFTRCNFCSRAIEIETVLNKQILQSHDDNKGYRCYGSGKSIKDNDEWLRTKKRYFGSELDMPKNIKEDHEAFRDIITSNKPVTIKLKEKIKNGSIFHQGRTRKIPPKNTEPTNCPICGEVYWKSFDCYYGDCRPKSTKFKPPKISVEILES